MPYERPQDNPHHEHRWLILGVIGIAQLMVILDATIVNIALPSAQEDLGFADDSRQWVITAYALAFGSLLLLGGRLGDLFGRKWAFIGGLLGFAVASAVGGAAGSFGVLVTARAAQGVFGAILAPSALALLSTIFVDPAERGKAFGIYGAIAGGGAAVGLLLGGILTEILTWRWCLYVNLLFAVPTALAALRFLHNEAHPARPPLDLLGTVIATSGLFALVYGFSNSEMQSWGDPVTIIMLAAAAVLLVLFVFIERRVEHPLLPLRVVADRTRGGAFSAIFISGIAMFAAFLFLTYFLQQTKGFTPIQTGLAFLPMTAAIMVTATSVNIRFLNVVGPRPLMVLGMSLGAVAMVWLAQLTPSSSYAGHVLPALIVMGVGMGNIFAPAFATATYGVDARDTGVASATVNTMQQVGGSIGVALLSSIFASAVTSYAEGRPPSPQVAAEAAVHGYTVAFWVAAGVFAIGAVVIGLMMRSVKVEQEQEQEQPGGEPAMAHSA
jgi:EmrB/QacA subfamily drug resistance transporter